MGDPVCAAVSVLASALYTGIKEVCGGQCSYNEDACSRELQIIIESWDKEKEQTVIQTVYRSLEKIQKKYCGSIRIKEV